MKANINQAESIAIPRHIYQKETIKIYRGCVIKNNEIRNPVIYSLYMGRSHDSSVVYATVHINNNDVSIVSWGSAGGGGYDKHSAAIGDALRRANISLFHPDSKYASISGRGESAIRESIIALIRALGYRGSVSIFS